MLDTPGLAIHRGASGTPEKTRLRAPGRRTTVREAGFFRLSGAGVRSFGQRNPQLLRYQPDGFGKSDVLDFLHEAEDVS